MKHLCTWTLLLLSMALYAQDNEELKKFFKDTHKGKTHYSNGYLQKQRIEELKVILLKDEPIYVTTMPESLILTVSEKEYAINQAIELTNEPQQAYLNGVNDFKYHKEVYHRRNIQTHTYYSKPIFLRNNSVCITYHEHVAINKTTNTSFSGAGGWNIYIKQNGVWKHCHSLTGWFS